MDKQEHASRLRRAMALRGLSRSDIAAATGVRPRTVTNWTSGTTLPSERERAALRNFLGPYDMQGDPVEVAIRGSELTEDRQDTVLGFYKRALREQREETDPDHWTSIREGRELRRQAAPPSVEESTGS